MIGPFSEVEFVIPRTKEVRVLLAVSLQISVSMCWSSKRYVNTCSLISKFLFTGEKLLYPLTFCRMLSHLVLSLQSKRNMIVNFLRWDDSLGYTLQEELTALFHTGESRGGVRAPPYFQAKLKPRGPRKIIF